MLSLRRKGLAGVIAASLIGAGVAGLAAADYQAGQMGPMMGGGYGPGMMGQGMMGMHDGLPGINLDDQQRKSAREYWGQRWRGRMMGH